MRATRDASGWNTAEPTPMSAAASKIAGYDAARDMASSPTSVNPMPIVSEYGCGRRSV